MPAPTPLKIAIYQCDACDEDATARLDRLDDAGVTPGLATVLMSDDGASETYVSMKQRDCEEVGMNGIHVELDPEAPAEEEPAGEEHPTL